MKAWERILQCLNINQLYPPQKEALKSGLLEGRNLVLATPTASGKTLVAALAIAEKLSRSPGGKAFYTVPLRSIAFEKKDFFTQVAQCMGLRSETVVGDLEVPEWKLRKADIIVSTYEKFDSILRKRPSILDETEILVVDEIHYVSDPKRGPILETLVATVKHKAPHTQILGLSATIGNADTLASWLEARLIESDWRPVPLVEGVYYDGVIRYLNRRQEQVSKVSGHPAIDVAVHAARHGKQALIFTQSRRQAASLAKRLSQYSGLLEYDRKKAREYSLKLMEAQSRTPTGQTLSELVAKGVAFHHAGLSNQQRTLIENAFREGAIAVISATPTLAAGVNLPAAYVVVESLRRYEDGGWTPISVSEYKQLAGRAGRPGYDEEGRAIIASRSREAAERVLQVYILGGPEPVTSKLASPRVLRAALLGLVVGGLADSRDEILSILNETLYSVQAGTLILESMVDTSLSTLENWEMLKTSKDGVLRATRLGKTASLLYLDPETALIMVNNMKNRPKASVFGLLHLAALTPDAIRVRFTRRELEALDELFYERYDELIALPSTVDVDEETYYQALKTALVVEEWIEETPLAKIEESYGVLPGDLSAVAETMRWLVYSMAKLSALYRETSSLQNILYKLEKRIQYGVKEELLELTMLHGVGRVRARLLYRHGFHGIEDLRKATIEDLVKVPTIGYLLAKSILEQVKGKQEETGETRGERERMGLERYI